MVGVLELTEGRGRPRAERWTLLGLELLAAMSQTGFHQATNW